MVLQYIQLLPCDVKNIILQYVRPVDKIRINQFYREVYMKQLLSQMIQKQAYIRYCVKNDYDFLLSYPLRYNKCFFVRKIEYRDKVYKHYLGYLSDLIHYYGSTKCKMLLEPPKQCIKNNKVHKNNKRKG